MDPEDKMNSDTVKIGTFIFSTHSYFCISQIGLCHSDIGSRQNNMKQTLESSERQDLNKTFNPITEVTEM